jgi:hypothetical protein
MMPVDLPAKYMPVTQWGAPIRVYQLPGWKLAIRVVAILVLLGGGGAFAWMLLTQQRKPDDRTALGFGIGFTVIAAAAVAWGTLQRARTSAVAYENGFAFSDGGEVRAWGWDEVASVTMKVTVYRTHGVPVYTSHAYPLAMANGERLVLTGYLDGVSDLAARLREATFRVLFPRHAEAYNKGETLDFGPVRVGRDLGVEVRQKVYPWAEIEKAWVADGSLQLKQRGKSFLWSATVPASSIPNLDVLMGILGQVLPQAPG